MGPERAGNRRRGPRRADAPGTGPASADGPEPGLAGLLSPVQEAAPDPGGTAAPAGAAPAAGTAAAPLDEHDRWLLEQRPPHWG